MLTCGMGACLQRARQAPNPKEWGLSVAKIFGTSYVREHSTKNNF